MNDPRGRPRKGYTISFPPDDLATIQAHWRRTYPEHGISFNAWVIETILFRVMDEQE